MNTLEFMFPGLFIGVYIFICLYSVKVGLLATSCFVLE